MFREKYTSGDYLKKNPTWHAEDSPWKAKNIIQMMERNNIEPKTICEIGCGAGEILKQLQYNMKKDCIFYGYEISPEAFELCKKKSNERLHFAVKDILQEKDVFFDMILLIDLIEHMEDYYSFLRGIKQKGQYKMFHIPLDLSVQSLLRYSQIMKKRELVGHIHYFTKEIALQILQDTGYKIIDWFYPTGSKYPAKSIRSYIARLVRKHLFTIHKDLAVRIMGERSLMVLAK